MEAQTGAPPRGRVWLAAWWALGRCAEGVLTANSRILGLLTLLKTAYLLTLLAGVWFWPDMNISQFYDAFQRWPRTGGPIFASHFATWDTAHYLYLSEVGYSAGAKACAFYPLWPLSVKWLSAVTTLTPLLTGLLMANACSLAAWVLFYRLVARCWGNAVANWALAFLIAFPGSLFFQFNYTESLFLLLVLLLWWGLQESRSGWSWAAGFLLPLTRAVGVFVLVPIGWNLLERAWQSLPKEPKPDNGSLSSTIDATIVPSPHGGPALPGTPWFRYATLARLAVSLFQQPLWLMLAPLCGWALYLILMWSWTSNPLEGFEAQKYWGVHSISNLWNLPKLVEGLLKPTHWHEFTGSVLDRAVFLMVLNCVPLLWRLDKRLLLWVYILAVLPAMSGTFTSFTRFASCVFPVFIALGAGLEGRDRRWARYSVLTLFTALHIVLVWRFVNFRWAG